MSPVELMELAKGWDSFTPVRGNRGEEYEGRLVETINLLSNSRGLPPHQAEFLLREALTTSDFPLLFGDVLDGRMVAAYKAVDPVWKLFSKSRPTTKDFRVAHDYLISGGDQILAEVAEKGEYLASDRT